MKEQRICFMLGLFVLFFVCFAPISGFSSETYRIKKGDTLSGISKKYHTSVQALQEANHMGSSFLSLNQSLVIPTKKNNIAKKSRRVSSPGSTKNTA